MITALDSQARPMPASCRTAPAPSIRVSMGAGTHDNANALAGHRRVDKQGFFVLMHAAPPLG